MLAAAKGTSRQQLAEKDLLASTSIEMMAHQPEDAARIAAHLPANTCVYINHLQRNSLADILEASVAVRRAGLEPVPHIVARRVGAASELDTFLARACQEAGVRKALLLGGDLATPKGPYADARALLDLPLARFGVLEVGFAGYPEGHPRIASSILAQALRSKIERAQDQGLSAFVVTQFSFAPARIVSYCAHLKSAFPAVPVYIGVPGPTSPVRLLKYAQACGVNASLRALNAQGFGAVRLVTKTDPAEQLAAVAQHVEGATSNVTGLHVYSFGGAEVAASWISSRMSAGFSSFPGLSGQ